MKPSIAITLITCGTLLVLTPAVYNFMIVRNAASVLVARADLIHISTDGSMSGGYQFVCWAVGAVMVGIAIVQSVRLPRPVASVSLPVAAA